MNFRSLADLKEGEMFVLQQFTDDATAVSLMELGCTPRSSLQVVRRAPLGCPLYVKVNQVILGIRREDAKKMIGI